MAVWDKLKDQAKALQQNQGGRGATGGQSGGTRSGGGSKAQLIGVLKTQLGSLKTELKSGAYRDASMAVCALVAAADGQVDPAERQQVESMILSNDVLQNFPPEQLRQRFNKHVDQLTMNFQHGKAEAMQELAKAAKKPTEAGRQEAHRGPGRPAWSSPVPTATSPRQRRRSCARPARRWGCPRPNFNSESLSHVVSFASFL
ncbi:hypothetical protein SUDANB57_00001 [Streptomyces sp. enrichment culture]